jgi:hypothetical protein
VDTRGVHGGGRVLSAARRAGGERRESEAGRARIALAVALEPKKVARSAAVSRQRWSLLDRPSMPVRSVRLGAAFV